MIISSPRQGSTWKLGNDLPIRWDTAALGGTVEISLSRQGGKTGTFETIATSEANDGVSTWTVSGAGSVNCALRIEPTSNPSLGTTQSLFTISEGGGGDLPTLILPANNSTVNTAALTFEWSTVTNAATYEIWVDNKSGFGSREINKTGLAGTTDTVTNHLPDNLYYWKVRAKLTDGSHTSWSDTWQFTYHLPVYTEPYWAYPFTGSTTAT